MALKPSKETVRSSTDSMTPLISALSRTGLTAALEPAQQARQAFRQEDDDKHEQSADEIQPVVDEIFGEVGFAHPHQDRAVNRTDRRQSPAYGRINHHFYRRYDADQRGRRQPYLKREQRAA